MKRQPPTIWRSPLLTAVLTSVVLASVTSPIGAQKLDDAERTRVVSEFVQRMRVAVRSTGHDPDTEAHHWVILINTVRTQGPGAQWARDVVHHLLTKYMVNGDRVSLVPYQLRIRSEAVFNQPFDPARAEDLYRQLPVNPDMPAEGHDTELALLRVLEHVGQPSEAIYIVLSDSEVSHRKQHPSPRDTIKAWNAALGSGLLREADRNRIEGTGYDAYKRAYTTYLYYRIYTPSSLQSLAAPVKRPPEDHNVGRERQDRERQDRERQERERRARLLVALLILATLSALLIWGMSWLMAARKISIRFEGADYEDQVRLGTPLKLGGSDCGGRELAGMPEGIMLCTLRVDWTGNVILEASGAYHITAPSQPVHVTCEEKTVVLESGQETVEMEIRRS